MNAIASSKPTQPSTASSSTRACSAASTSRNRRTSTSRSCAPRSTPTTRRTSRCWPPSCRTCRRGPARPRPWWRCRPAWGWSRCRAARITAVPRRRCTRLFGRYGRSLRGTRGVGMLGLWRSFRRRCRYVLFCLCRCRVMACGLLCISHLLAHSLSPPSCSLPLIADEVALLIRHKNRLSCIYSRTTCARRGSRTSGSRSRST